LYGVTLLYLNNSTISYSEHQADRISLETFSLSQVKPTYE